MEDVPVKSAPPHANINTEAMFFLDHVGYTKHSNTEEEHILSSEAPSKSMILEDLEDTYRIVQSSSSDARLIGTDEKQETKKRGLGLFRKQVSH